MGGKGAKVRFGTQGEGVAPNYQVDHKNGETVAYRGSIINRIWKSGPIAKSTFLNATPSKRCRICWQPASKTFAVEN